MLFKIFIKVLIIKIALITAVSAQPCVVRTDAVPSDINWSKTVEVKKIITLKPSLKELALFKYVERGDEVMVSWLMEQGVNINCTLEKEKGSLSSDLDKMLRFIFLLEPDKNVNQSSSKSFVYIPIVSYAYPSYPKITRRLIRAGAKPYNTMYNALVANDDSTVMVLLNKGFSINGDSEYSPMIQACKENKTYVVKELLDLGANVNISDDLGNTPIKYAFGFNNASMITLLLGKGAQVPNGLPFDPLDKAIEDSDVGMIGLLLKGGANSSLSAGKAACTGNPEIVKLYIYYKADFYGAFGLDDKCYYNSAIHALLVEYGVQSDSERRNSIKRGEEFYLKYCNQKEQTSKLTSYLRGPLIYFGTDKKYEEKIMLESAERGDTVVAEYMILKHKQIIPYQDGFYGYYAVFGNAIKFKKFDYCMFLINKLPKGNQRKEVIQQCVNYSERNNSKKMLKKFESLLK